MNFENAVGVSYSRRAQMAGDHLPIRYLLEINIRCTAIGEGPSTLHSQINEEEAFAGSKFYQDISINGTSFGSGYVSNLQADPEGPDVKTKNYTATVTITKGGDLDSVIGAIDKDSSQYIDSISESYSQEKSSHRRIVTHACSIKFNQPSAPDDSIIKGMLGDSSKLESLFGIDLASVYIFKNYSYDESSQSYNFQETREWVENELSDSSNIVIRQNSFQYSNGIITATTSVEVTNITEGASVQERADAALDKASSFLGDEAGGVFGSYSDLVIGKKDDLKSLKVNESLILNRNEAKCTASTTFSNAPDITSNGLVYWEYGIETQILGDETIKSEEGTIIGAGVYISIDEIAGSANKYQNANDFFGSFCGRGEAKARCDGEICISESISRNYGEGTINYRYSFSNNKSLLYDDGDGGSTIERKKIISTNQQDPLSLHSTFIIPQLKELLQTQSNKLPNLNINSVNISTNSSCSLSDFVSNLYKPNNDEIADSLSIRFSPQKRECICEARYFKIGND